MADNRVLADLLHGNETDVWGDQAYRVKAEVIGERAPKAVGRAHQQYRAKLVC